MWALESQAGQGLLGHLHGSGPGLWLRTQSTSVQRPAWRAAHGCNLPQETLKLPLVTQGLEASPDQREVRETREGRQGALTALRCVLGERLPPVSAQQTMSSQARSLDSLEHRFPGRLTGRPSTAGCREEEGAGGLWGHGEEGVTGGSGIPLPCGPRV